MLDSSTDLKSMLSDPSLLQTQAFINNQWVDGENGATFDVSNPARGDVIAQVADLSRPIWRGRLTALRPHKRNGPR